MVFTNGFLYFAPFPKTKLRKEILIVSNYFYQYPLDTRENSSPLMPLLLLCELRQGMVLVVGGMYEVNFDNPKVQDLDWTWDLPMYN